MTPPIPAQPTPRDMGVVDLTGCDREPIHQLGAIQPFGFLMMFSADWLVARVSANIAAHIGITPENILGMSVRDIFAREAIHTLRNRLVLLYDDDAVERMFGVALLAAEPDRLFDCAVHRSGPNIVVEAEPTTPIDPNGSGNLIRAMMNRLETARDMTVFLRQGARQMHGLTGYDRVMIYRFQPDGSGEVVAEAVRGGLDSYLGLHYPASDIPAQARTLYIRTPFRIIADVDDEPAAIIPSHDETGAPMDLSLSILRAVSPTHIQYMKNMQVAASLSVSIIVGGRLWGLFACHHRVPRCPSFADRTVAELFGQMFALKLEARERQIADGFETAAKAAGDRLLAAVAGDVGLLENPGWIAETVGSLLPCDGVTIWLDGRTAHSGHVPPLDILPAITRQLNMMPGGRVFATDHLAGLVPELEGKIAVAAGMMAIPISRRPRDYVLLFRQEKLRSVIWAGDPAKSAPGDTGGTPLTPRASFAAWREEVRGRSEPFSEAEVNIAETLRVSLIEVVLRLTERAEGDRRRATERQELLIAELNHRVRNILGLIRGLVRQSQQPGMGLAGYIAVLEGRLQALGRAHDQITEDKWSAARLRTLFETEAASYVANADQSLTISGEEVMLEPTAFSTMALVVHELVTNSSKYGALAAGGRVLVHWAITRDGGLTIDWREQGGPIVRPPNRRGFGTTIIERSIPYDLGGVAKVDYPPGGLEAHFQIPARHVHRVTAGSPPAAPLPIDLGEATIPAAPPLVDCAILLVEDSLIIAMDAEDLLLQLGATTVSITGTVGAALEELARFRPDMAVLDVNLGSEMSFPVAERLRALDIPFIFATGYGNQMAVPDDYTDVTILQKPYTLTSLSRALGGLRG